MILPSCLKFDGVKYPNALKIICGSVTAPWKPVGGTH